MIENIKVWGQGEYIDGVDAHIEFLSQWFSDASGGNYLLLMNYRSRWC